MCGIFGIINAADAARKTYYGLHALQHRGQESAGIVTTAYDAARKRAIMPAIRNFGLVTDVFRDDAVFQHKLAGDMAIGHNRYSTSGSSTNAANIQPFVVHYRNGNLAIAHNGNLSNATQLRQLFDLNGTLFQTTSDTEVILHLIAQSRQFRQRDQILDAVSQVEGAFSLILMTDDKLIAVRDPHGFRPLMLGRIDEAHNQGKPAWCVASESCAFDLLGATYVREIQPGEMLVMEKEACETGNFESYLLKPTSQTAQCIFEYVYFSRPDSRIFGEMVDKVRRKFGKTLAHEAPAPFDSKGKRTIVIPVPDSSNTSAMGYATELNKIYCHEGERDHFRFEFGLIRNHYVGRTFISPGQNARELKVRLKFNTVEGVLKDRIVVMVDDSIVRGTTCRQLVKMVREAGAREVHFRVTSPPVISPCYYGMDFPTPDELFANQFEDIDGMAAWLGVDSLAYLSEEGLLEAVRETNSIPPNYCTACFTNKYPVPVQVPKETEKEAFEFV
ncbi:MAG TPA: amidophosphoribosyltransferase [Rhodothermales bacterium]|nr:amidophosphoribosyltransferase [Rhodothermales bacterium]